MWTRTCTPRDTDLAGRVGAGRLRVRGQAGAPSSWGQTYQKESGSGGPRKRSGASVVVQGNRVLKEEDFGTEGSWSSSVSVHALVSYF